MNPTFDTQRYADFFQKSLNPGQQKAVAPREGVYVVRAGAGSGKTRVITARMLNLMICHNVPANRIVALTFTNKAAREMRERMEHFIPQSPLPFINTFHAYCLRLLRTWGHVIGLETFSLIDDQDQEKLAKTILERVTLPAYVKMTPGKLVSMISRHKNSQLGISESWFTSVFSLYEREKRLARCLDFDDLLTTCKNLLRDYPEVRAALQQSIDHILVDEYQDTNVVQHELLQYLSLTDEKKLAVTSLCVVGDEDQSIYGWRGATVDNMLHFSETFAQAQYITIDQNYRSTISILQAANAVITHNRQRVAKNLWSDKPGAQSVRVITCASSYQEATWISLVVQEYQKIKPGSPCAVLYRSHYISRSIEEALVRDNIAYTMVGGVRFYDRQEIKDILAYARCMVNPYDRVSLLRIFNTPHRGLGSTTQEALLEMWAQEPLLDAPGILKLFASQLPLRKQTTLERLIEILGLGDTNSDSVDILTRIVTKTGWNAWLKEQYEPEEAEERIKNVQELLHAAQAAQQRGITTLGNFLEEIALVQDDPRAKTGTSPVSLMTLHAAKGLEFPLVILCGVEETVLPSGVSLSTPEGIEEERRLMYVGITRAQDALCITHAHQRALWGSMNSQIPSRFVSELPANTVRDPIAVASLPEMRTRAHQWLQESLHLRSTERSSVERATAPAQPRIQPATPTAPARFTEGQRVRHAQFGIGTVQEVITKSTVATVTVRFPSYGVKKLSGAFLQPVS